MNYYQQWDDEYVWHPFDTFAIDHHLHVTKALGDKLYLQDGRVMIDGISSWWVNLHGHAHPHIVNAICEQAHQLPHVIFAGFTHTPAIELAKGLLETLPTTFSKVFYSDNGSTAVEVAIKMALQYWHNKNQNKTTLLAFENAYHGDTFGAMAVGGRSVYNQVFEPFLFEVKFLPLPDSEANLFNCLQLAKHYLDTENVAGFIYEPLLQGAAGMLTYPAQNLDTVISLCKEHQVMCIADEVFTGFYRTGKMWASQHCTTMPDIICASKGITGGFMPLGATICQSHIYQAFEAFDKSASPKTFMHGHSYTGNALACAAGLASLKLLAEPETQSAIANIVQQTQQFALKEANNQLQIRNIGTILAISKGEQDQYYGQNRYTYYQKSLTQGILLRPIGNTLYTVPMYCSTTDTLQRIHGTILNIVNEE